MSPFAKQIRTPGPTRCNNIIANSFTGGKNDCIIGMLIHSTLFRDMPENEIPPATTVRVDFLL